MSPSHVELTDFTGMDFALKKNCAEQWKQSLVGGEGGRAQNFWPPPP